MGNGPDAYDLAEQFAALFRRFEFALKRTGFLANKEVAEADWRHFARSLGTEFFDHVIRSNIAPNIISEPPRKLMKDGLTWTPERPRALGNVEELFVLGVCRVRNNYLHGEKFVSQQGNSEWERDVVLVREALAILREAESRGTSVSAVIRIIPTPHRPVSE